MAICCGGGGGAAAALEEAEAEEEEDFASVVLAFFSGREVWAVDLRLFDALAGHNTHPHKQRLFWNALNKRCRSGAGLSTDLRSPLLRFGVVLCL